MPLYDFKCDTCGKVKEEFLWLSQLRSNQKCSCGGNAQRQIGCFGGIKVGDIVMSVVRKGRPDEDADENWYRCLSVVAARGEYKPPDTPGERVYEKHVLQRAKEENW